MGEFGLQRIVDGIANRGLEERLGHCVVSHCIEGESSKVTAKIKVIEPSDRVWSTSEGVGGITAKRYQLLH